MEINCWTCWISLDASLGSRALGRLTIHKQKMWVEFGKLIGILSTLAAINSVAADGNDDERNSSPANLPGSPGRFNPGNGSNSSNASEGQNPASNSTGFRGISTFSVPTTLYKYELHPPTHGDDLSNGHSNYQRTGYYHFPFKWRVVYKNYTDSVSSPNSGIPLGQDGNCEAFDGNPKTESLGNVIPKIKGNSDKVGGMVGNQNPKGCTHLWQEDRVVVDYCGLGEAPFAQFNESIYSLMTNCTGYMNFVFQEVTQGRVYLAGLPHSQQNWLQVMEKPQGVHRE